MELPDKFLWYTLRSINTMVADAGDKLYVYAKLPGILLISSINPVKYEGWKKSKIENSGKFTIPQEITNTEVLQRLIERARVAMKLSLPENEQKKIALAMHNKPERVLKSETLKTVLSDDKQRREKLRGKLNRTVQQLVDIIDCFQFEKEPSQEAQSIT